MNDPMRLFSSSTRLSRFRSGAEIASLARIEILKCTIQRLSQGSLGWEE